MRRVAEIVLGAVAAIAAVVFAWGAAGRGIVPLAGEAPARYYHGGKDAAVPAVDPSCQKGNCHAGLPHGKSGAEAAFRNMHMAFAECLACHGKDAEGRWAPGGARGAGRVLRYAAPEGRGNDRHEHVGRALACRSCHSEAGREAIVRTGIRNLPNNFAAPIALRMIEERGKKWVTDEMR